MINPDDLTTAQKGELKRIKSMNELIASENIKRLEAMKTEPEPIEKEPGSTLE